MIYELQREVLGQKGVWETLNSYTDVELALVEEERLRREDSRQEYRVVGSNSGTGLRKVQK